MRVGDQIIAAMGTLYGILVDVRAALRAADGLGVRVFVRVVGVFPIGEVIVLGCHGEG
jgi:hypothetical protein